MISAAINYKREINTAVTTFTERFKTYFSTNNITGIPLFTKKNNKKSEYKTRNTNFYLQCIVLAATITPRYYKMIEHHQIL